MGPGHGLAPPVAAQAYFGLAPGRCFEYAEGDGGPATVGLVTASEPGGVALHLSHHGQEERVDHLSFDGGLVLLERQDFIAGVALTSRGFATPLLYLAAPLSSTAPSLSSSSSYSDVVSGADGGSGTESFEVDVIQAGTLATPAGSFFADELNVVGNAPSKAVNDRRWLSPDAGFVDLYLPDDQGSYVDFLLVDEKPTGPAAPCAAN